MSGAVEAFDDLDHNAEPFDESDHDSEEMSVCAFDDLSARLPDYPVTPLATIPGVV